MNLLDIYIPEWFFVALNLVILVLILKKLLWKPVLGILETRQEIAARADQDAEEAERLRAEMERLRAELDAEMAVRASELMTEARGAAGREYDRIVAEAETRAETIVKLAGMRAEQERERIMSGAREQMAAAVLDVAGSLIRANMDSERNLLLIDEYLKDMPS